MNGSQYPPPPQPEETHYAPIYPAAPNAQMLDNGHPQQLNYGNPLGQNIFPKIESIPEVLQQQAHQATHALSDQRALHAPGGDAQKPNRLRKACDSCSIRKVKCDESGPPCRACAALDIPCTFDRPSRRRGPPNRHAEAIKKKRRLDGTELASGPSTPSSPTNAAHALAQLSTQPQLSAEQICPIPTMQALIDDFFNYIHPLCPFPHEPWFREAWQRREDYSNPSFLALLASMVACLVASFPRKPRLHIKTQTVNQYPTHLALVDKCREVCAHARGVGYLDRPNLSIHDACTSYFLGLTGAYTFQWRQLRLYFGESLTILRALGLHKASEQGYTQLGGVPNFVGSDGPDFEGSRDAVVDNVTEQMGRRLFWTVFVGARTMQQLGASFGELSIPPPTPSDPYPPLPAEVDDAFIYPNEILPQPPGMVSLITGFNINARIYSSFSKFSAEEMTHGVGELFDWDRQKRILDDCLRACKSIILDAPEILKVHPEDSRDGRFGQRTQPYYPPIPGYTNARDPALQAYDQESGEAKRKAQYEIQKANIYATHLSIRSYLVEKYFDLLDKHNKAKALQELNPDAVEGLATGFKKELLSASKPDVALEQEMDAERSQVVKDVLVVLGSIDMVNMEPNGDSFTQKIRQIASTLLEVPKDRRGSVAQQHQDYLWKFLDILSKLERVSPDSSDPNQPADEETQLRLWADLREHQLKFQEQGGIYGFS